MAEIHYWIDSDENIYADDYVLTAEEVVKRLNEYHDYNIKLSDAAKALMDQIVYDHPGATGFTVLMDHEPLYALAKLCGGLKWTKEEAEKAKNEIPKDDLREE